MHQHAQHLWGFLVWGEGAVWFGLFFSGGGGNLPGLVTHALMPAEADGVL